MFIWLIKMAFFISDLNKSNDGKFLYLVGSVLQNWADIYAIVSVPYFLVLGFRKRVTLQFRWLYLRSLFVKASFIIGAERPWKYLLNSIINIWIFFTWIVVSLLFDRMSLNFEVSSFSNAVNRLTWSPQSSLFYGLQF